MRSPADHSESDRPSRDVDRRAFLRHSAVATAALATVGGRLDGPASAAGTPTSRVGNPTKVADFELDEATVVQLQRDMASGKYTSLRLTELYLARIGEIDRPGSGPSINSVIEINPDAVAIADFLDVERKAKGPRGPLHGIPVLIKDNIDTADKMRTSAGSLALADSIAPLDSGVAKRLRDAGAVIIGKTNLSEWANFRSSHSSSGWSGRGGQTRNPYALDRNPCGSSAGTGASIAASLAAIGVGTETDGSIVCPSNANGLVGIKPTVGLVSRAGIIPISSSQDTAGPMCRTVADAAALLGVLAGEDARDPATARARGKMAADYTRFLDAAGLKGARIGVARDLFSPTPSVAAVFEESLAALKSAGAVLIDPISFKILEQLGDAEGVVFRAEFKVGLKAYLASLGPRAPYKSLADLIRYNDENRDREMPFFGQETFLAAEKAGPLTSPAYRAALEKCRRLTRGAGIDAAMSKHRLDAIVAPTGGPAWTTDLVNGDHFTGESSTLAAVAGYPSITVPSGFIHGLPVGLSFIGGPWQEGALVRFAFAFEQATKVRRKPAFLPT
ncbi:MAG: amidase, partial [Gemmatimonadaceae bacterium]